jgi:hypothetical protein
VVVQRTVRSMQYEQLWLMNKKRFCNFSKPLLGYALILPLVRIDWWRIPWRLLLAFVDSNWAGSWDAGSGVVVWEMVHRLCLVSSFRLRRLDSLSKVTGTF